MQTTDPVLGTMQMVTKGYTVGMELVQTSYLFQGLLGLFALAVIGAAVYYRDKINIGGAFDFLNYIPMKIVLVVGGAFCTAFVIVMAFAFKDMIGGYMSIVYWLILPLMIYVISLTITIMNQLNTAKTIDIGLAASSSVKPMAVGFVGLVLGKSAYVRAPVASAFPILNSLKGIDDILEIERYNPAIEGLGVAYWVWWFLVISQTAALGDATIHPS